MKRVALALLLLLSSGIAHAQVTTADLVGTIRDSSRGVVPGAKVTLTNQATGVSRSATTGPDGNYIFTSLQPGIYTLAAEATGFRKVQRTGVQLQVNQRAQIDLDLEVGLGETVLIEGTAPLLESQSSVLGSVIQEKQVQDLPLNGRNFVQLATLSPGVSGAGSGMRGTIMSGTRPDDLRPGTELFVNGNRENANNYLYDGIDNNTRLTLVIVMRPNVEAIKEFKVQTNLFSAEQGRNPGGQVNVVTKSGGNEIHGAGYGFLRNDRFDANNFFANRAGQKKPPFKQYQFGGAIGGPIVKNKTFFFADYDGFRQELGRVFVNTVPTLKMRRGDFSELSGVIYDPATTVALPGGGFSRQPFPGNIIPQDRWDPVTAKLINAYPAPTSSALSNNLVTTPTRTQDWNQFDVRIDHTQSERNNFLARYSWSRTATTNPYTFPAVQLAGVSKEVGLGNEDTFAGTSGLVAQHAVLGWVHVFSPRLVLDSRVGYNRFDLDFAQAGVAVGDELGEQLGVPNANQQDEQNGIPIFSPAGYTGIGQSRSLPILRDERTFQYVANLTYAAAKHTIKAGLDVRRRHMGEFQTNRGNGRFNFAPNITNNPANNTGGHAMAAFLLGAPSLIEQDYLLADVAIRGTEYGVYVADDWRATPRLSLNLGLRYELDTPFTEEANQWARFDPNTVTVLVAGRNGVSETTGIKTFTKAFAPRLGFAYRLGERTVLRGGAGIFWNTPGHGGNVLRLHRHLPFGPIYSFNPGNQFVTRRVSDGFPAIPPLNLAFADNPTGSVIGVDPDYQPGYARQFNLTVERELPGSLLLKASYVGNQGRHLDFAYNLNQAVPGTGPVNNRRPFFAIRPALADVTWAVSDGTSDYHAFQFSAEKRLTNGLGGLLSYTWAHSIDTVGQSFGGGADGPLPQDPRNPFADRGSSPFDIRHRLTVAWTWQLPFGRGRRWLNREGLAEYLLGGWQVNGINTFQTGLPFTPTLNAATVNTGTGSRPDRIGTGGTLSNPTVDRWFDIAAFATPAQFTYGNSGRNILYGPGRVNFDFSMFKEFRVKEGVAVQFRAEAFNLFNTPQFDLPNAAIGAGNAGTITAIVGTPRQIQFGAKIVF
jgi:outer membrane receptor protein involved in Fe transport